MTFTLTHNPHFFHPITSPFLSGRHSRGKTAPKSLTPSFQMIVVLETGVPLIPDFSGPMPTLPFRHSHRGHIPITAASILS
jgi:hypothetical protein